MPCFDGKFGVLAIGNRLPTGSQRFLERRLQQIFIDRLYRDAVDSCTQRFLRNKMVGGMRDVDGDGLTVSRKRKSKTHSEADEERRAAFSRRTTSHRYH